jgi:uncharacterized protein (TIGR02246 family)
MLTPVEELLAVERIKQLKARYFRTLDTKDWAGWGQVFTTDATMTVDWAAGPQGRSTEPAATGRENIVTFVRGRIDPATTVHHGHMPEIEITSPTTARGVWSMEDIVETPERSMNGHGHYHETYRIEDGAWRIASLHLTRLRVVARTPA